MPNKKAFTLIELLVVIAIIAILAAILFPVFAQAKEAAKKTADLSNVKQIATAVAMYQGDSDDLNPLQAGMDSTGTWGYNYNKYVPADWSASPSPAARVQYSQSFALNTMQPYVKNYDMLVIPSAPVTEYQAGTTIAAGKTKPATSYAYNGFLSAYSATSVVNPAMLPLFTNANGFVAQKGWGFANPALTCPQPNVPCTYQPYSATCSTSVNGQTGSIYTTVNSSSYWSFSRGQNWALNDTHAKFRKVGSSATGDPNTDPWTGYDSTGHAASYVYDGCHAWLFRPDYDFAQ